MTSSRRGLAPISVPLLTESVRTRGGVLATLVALTVLTLSPRGQAANPSGDEAHAVEALGGKVLTGIVGPNDGFGPPRTGAGWGGMLGYRYREARWWELSITPGLSVYEHSWQWSVPMVAHLRLPLPGGHGLTFGLGVGVQRFSGSARSEPELRSSYLGFFAQAVLGAAIQMTPRWAMVLATTVNAGPGSSKLQNRSPGDYDENARSQLMVGASVAAGVRRAF